MDTEKKILYAASEEFAKNGYYGTTIRKICKRAKVNVAAVNYHFDSKESLYRKVFSFLFEETEVDRLLLPLQTHSDEEAKSALKNWIKGFLGVLVNPDKLNEFKFKIMFREMLDPTDIFQQIFMEFIKPRISVVENYLRKKLPPGTPYEEICIYQFSITAQCLFYFNNRITVSYLSEDKSFPRNSVEKIADFITDSIWFNLEKYKK